MTVRLPKCWRFFYFLDLHKYLKDRKLLSLGLGVRISQYAYRGVNKRLEDGERMKKRKAFIPVCLVFAMLFTLVAGPAAFAALSFNEKTFTGAYGTFNGPTASVVYNGKLYVTDFYNGRVVEFDADTGNFLFEYGQTGSSDNQFNCPSGIAVDGSGFLYVADIYNNRIIKFKPNNGAITGWTTFGSGYNMPQGVTVKGTNVYVADTYNNRILKFSDLSGSSFVEIGSAGDANGKFMRPYDIAVDSFENIWVCDTFNNRVQKLDKNGVYIGKVTSNMCYGISVDKYDNIYVAERQNSVIKCIKAYATPIAFISTSSGFVRPIGTDVDSNDKLWVVDVNSGKVHYAQIQNPNIVPVTSAITLDIPASNTNDKLDVSSSVNLAGGVRSGILPAITINAHTSISTLPIQVEIPAGTTVTGPAGWTEEINVPTVKANNTVDPGTGNTVNSVIEIGFGSTLLTFDQAVKIVIPGKAGQQVGYSHGGGALTPITRVLTGNTQAIANAEIPAGGEGKIDVGADLVIWTKHFTLFATYTYTGGGGGGGGGVVQNKIPAAAPRIAGVDRFETAIAIAEQGWPNGADTVVLAYGYDFPDALAVAPLAKKLNAPILLTDKITLTSSTLAEIQKLKAKKIVLAGGTGVISQNIQDSLVAAYGQANVTRYGGESRYATAAAIAGALGNSTGKAIIVNGENGHYSDALAVSPYAAANGIPILFTRASALPAETSKVITDQKVTSTIVIGGEGAVSAGVLSQLPSAVRYGGENRYATSTTIINGLDFKYDKVFIVTGLNFPDALVAGNLAAYTQSPLLMVDKGLPDATKTFLTTNKASIKDMSIIGGQGAVSTSQVNEIQNTLK
jgi:putative cell wall-binding protein